MIQKEGHIKRDFHPVYRDGTGVHSDNNVAIEFRNDQLKIIN